MPDLFTKIHLNSAYGVFGEAPGGKSAFMNYKGESEPPHLSRLVTKDNRLAMFAYYNVRRDYPKATWDGFATVVAPITPEIFESYIAFLKRKFPMTLGDIIYSIERA